MENILENIFGFREGKLNKENATRIPTVPSRTYLEYEGERELNVSYTRKNAQVVRNLHYYEYKKKCRYVDHATIKTYKMKANLVEGQIR